MLLEIERGGVARTVTVQRERADALYLGLVNVAQSTHCRSVRMKTLSEEQKSALLEGAFDENRGFRCGDAHEALKPHFGRSSLLMIRGGWRVLLTMPGGRPCA